MERLWFLTVALILCRGIASEAGTYDARVLRLALFATLVADFCFAFIKNPIYGVCAFCCVQMIYCLRYGGARMCCLLAGLWAIVLPALLLLNIEPLFIAAVMYAAAFACSLVAAFAAKPRYPYPNGRLVVWGMLLFACCDICVGINYLFPGSAYPLLWIFYLPGQALLSISGVPSLDKGKTAFKKAGEYV